MKLYHGSKAGIVGAIAPTSRGCCDFGRGFYMGSEPTQPMTLICRMEKPKFYTCEFDMSGLRVYRFEPTVDWAMFVAWNRGLMPEKYKDYYVDEKTLSPMECEQQRMRASPAGRFSVRRMKTRFSAPTACTSKPTNWRSRTLRRQRKGNERQHDQYRNLINKKEVNT